MASLTESAIEDFAVKQFERLATVTFMPLTPHPMKKLRAQPDEQRNGG